MEVVSWEVILMDLTRRPRFWTHDSVREVSEDLENSVEACEIKAI